MTEVWSPRPGRRLGRGWSERLTRFIVARTTLRAGTGVRIDRLPDGQVVSLDPGREYELAARIAEAPPFAPADPAAVHYTAVALGRPEVRLADAEPVYGRPTVRDGSGEYQFRIWPARVGDRCRIVRHRLENGDFEDRLEVMTEAIEGRRCTKTE